MNETSTLKVNEIFYSIQGESSMLGYPCVFIRLTYCNLRCSYCDTEYAFYEGDEMHVNEIIEKVKSYKCNLVEITGGEPLVQENVHILMKALCNEGYTVMLETSGSLLIDKVDKHVKIIMDLKTPSSKMSEKNCYENLHFLKRGDEIKFVIGDRKDYEWSKKIIKDYSLSEKNILFSPVYEKLDYSELAEWMLEDKMNVRLQIQLHKLIWESEVRGV